MMARGRNSAASSAALASGALGEIMKAIAHSRGCAGVVIDAAIRDADAFARDTFPRFVRAAIHAGPYKLGPSEINAPVSIGGMVVNPGDIVGGVMAMAAWRSPPRSPRPARGDTRAGGEGGEGGRDPPLHCGRTLCWYLRCGT